MLELQDISKTYGSHTVLHPLSLCVTPGETLVLIGPSGCGKSTLLRIMIGLIEPDSGSVRFDGEELTSSNVLKLRTRMGYVLQDGGLFPHMSIRDNIMLMARHLKIMTRDERDQRLDDLCNLTRFPKSALDRLPSKISGGQRQRVAIMRALMLDPPLLLFDEPLGALDPIVRYELQEDLKQIFEELKKAVVFVTHDLSEAAFFSSQVALLEAGQILQLGTIDEFASNPASDFVTRFLQAHRPLILDPT
ncbi:ATP-binding cassette domain-containing protein [Lacunimicrobium album]